MKTTSPLMTVRKTDPNLPYSTPVVAHPLPRPPPCRLFPPGKNKCHDTRHRDPDSVSYTHLTLPTICSV